MRPHREHPAAPEQVKHGFDEGYDVDSDAPENQRIGSFSEGLEQKPHRYRKRRFSEGIEQVPSTDEDDKTAERRFSEGLEEGADPDEP